MVNGAGYDEFVPDSVVDFSYAVVFSAVAFSAVKYVAAVGDDGYFFY